MTPEEQGLLELAASFVGWELTWADDRTMCWLKECYDGRMNVDDPWNPLRSGEDAFSLMAAAGISICHDEGIEVGYWDFGDGSGQGEYEMGVLAWYVDVFSQLKPDVIEHEVSIVYEDKTVEARTITALKAVVQLAAKLGQLKKEKES